MKNIIEDINVILSQWDPLNVGGDIALDEYRQYISQILKHINNKEHLIHYLESMLDDLGAGYDKKCYEHRTSLINVVDNLLVLGNS